MHTDQALAVAAARRAQLAAPDVDPAPRRRLAILTCMDVRLDPVAMFGLEVGDAHVIRNAGGLVTDDAIRSLSASQRLLGSEEIMVVMHEGCGLQKLSDEEFAGQLAEDGAAVEWELGAFVDLDAALRDGLARLRSSAALPRRLAIRGFAFSPQDGGLREVSGPAEPLPDDAARPPSSSLPRMLQPGDKAPDFTLPDQRGEELTLSELRGQTVVLYFYPRADTPGCTTQACGVRDRRAEYEAAGARVIGVSPDPVEAVDKFAAKFDLDFTLLADADHAVAEAYGTWVEKSMYGKKHWGVQRATFIVDPDGKIAKVFPKVSPKTHDDVVLAALVESASA